MTQSWLGNLKNRDRGIQFIQHLQNIVTPNIFNPRAVYNNHTLGYSPKTFSTQLSDRGIQFIQHLQNIVTPNIFNPRAVYNNHTLGYSPKTFSTQLSPHCYYI